MKNHIFFIQRTVRQQWDRNFVPDWYNEEHMAPFPLNSQRAILGIKNQQMSSCPKLSIVRAKFQENISKNRGPLLLLPVFAYGMEILPWGWHHWEYGGPEYPCCCLWRQGSHVKGGKLSTSGTAATIHWALSSKRELGGVTQVCASILAPSTLLRIRDLPWEEK